MRVVYQRVTEAEVLIAENSVGKIERGAMLLVGFTASDTVEENRWMAEKVANLRVFEDDAGKLNLSLSDVGGGVLAVSQFTLYGDCSRGRRPSFSEAAIPEIARPLYEQFLSLLREKGLRVESGVFGADMRVSLVNDGPVTLLLERHSSSK